MNHCRWSPTSRFGRTFALLAVCCATQPGFVSAQQATSQSLWNKGRVTCEMALPQRDPVGAEVARRTLNRHLDDFFNIKLPVVEREPAADTVLVIGTPDSNPLMATLVKAGAKLAENELGEEGFHLLSLGSEGRHYLIIHGRTPRALKHACQELVFYRIAATRESGAVDWPLNVVMSPQIPYRGCYMLPCWSAHDSLESWRRALRFNSELTLNRNWFWLDGFPVAGHSGEFAGTALAEERNVQELIDLANEEAMSIYIGGGWFNWQHEKAVGKDVRKGIDYYLAYLDTFKNFHGFYIEPSGEGAETEHWRPQAEALKQMISDALTRRPELEFALAIGRFNNDEYLKLMAGLDPKRVYWWWCWGDPLSDDALSLYPSVLRWHTTTQMSEYHGSLGAPRPAETRLAGITTSYDPGQGYGNSWNGWGRLGWDRPRDFHPYTIPYFAHQYYYRERCWNPKITEWQMTMRLQRRLFDADAPAAAGHVYWWLSRLTHAASMNQRPTPEQLDGPRKVLESMRGRAWTPRMADTLARMEEALPHLMRLAE